MAHMDTVLNDAVKTGAVPFVVGMVGNAGGVTYSGAAGHAAEGLAAGEDTVFRVFSMTKAVGSVAAMILIDQGKLSMDTPVADVLPAWNELKVLDRMHGDTPQMRAPTVQATARHLATHTSGLEYEFWNAQVPEFMEKTGHPTILSGLKTSLAYPLTNDPGTRWGYGPSIDWLGQMVEAIDGRRIDAFCKEEIFDPLGMTNTAFEPDGLESRLADVVIRGEDGAFGPMEIAPPPQPEVYGMGHALYSTAPDYMKFLRMILNKGTLDGQQVLSSSAADSMQADQMRGLSFEKMTSVSPLTADVELEGDPSHSFIAVVHREDVPGKRSAGTQSWAGVLNTHYWLDPKKDVAAVIMTQSLPFVEPQFMAVYDAYERAVYAHA
ncbi:MAG: serine hydrolase domain-containing protein [Pseudomonadota bacterium]